MLQSTPKSQYLGILSWDLHYRGPGQINDTMWPKVSHTLTRDGFISWSQLCDPPYGTGSKNKTPGDFCYKSACAP